MSFLTRPGFLVFVLVSSLPFAFFLWLFSFFLMAKGQSEKLYPSIHMIVVLKHTTDNKTMNALLDRITEVTGEQSVRLLSPKEIAGFLPAMKDGESVRVPSRFQHILSVRISFGQDSQGQKTYLLPQIKSLKEFPDQDPHVLMMELNEAWAFRLDALARMMEKLKVVGLIFSLLTLLGLFFYWVQIFRFKWLSGKSLSGSSVKGEPERKLMWQAASENTEETPLEEVVIPVLWGGWIAGFFSGLIALLSLMVIHPVLYPEGLDPFLSSGFSGNSDNLDWFLFPVMTGAFGWLSSAFSRI